MDAVSEKRRGRPDRRRFLRRLAGAATFAAVGVAARRASAAEDAPLDALMGDGAHGEFGQGFDQASRTIHMPKATAPTLSPQTAQITIPVSERLGQNVIAFEGLAKGFGDRLLIDDLSFRLPPGGIVGVIGPNGAGKTTLFRMITGQERPDRGTITIGESVKLGYVDQSRDTLDDSKTVWEEISAKNDVIQLGRREMNSRAYCAAFNFKGSDQQKKVGALSGGERNRVHLAKMLKSGANVLLLDEPTNDLDVETLRALEEALEDFAGCAVIISHDRWFLDRIATHMLAFEGDSHVEWFEGNFHDYEEDKKRRLGLDSTIPHRIKYKKLSR